MFPVHIDATMGLVIPRRGPVVSIFSAYVIIILTVIILIIIIIIIQRTEYLILILFINISIDCKIRQVFKVLMYFPEITRQNVSNTTIFAKSYPNTYCIRYSHCLQISYCFAICTNK